MTSVVGGGPPTGGWKKQVSAPPLPPLRPLAAAIAVVCAGTLLTGVGYAVSGHPDSRSGSSAGAGGPGDRTAGAGVPEQQAPDMSAPDMAAARAILDRRSRAVLNRDRAAFVESVDPAFRARQEDLFANLAKLPLAIWRLRAGSAEPAATGPYGWTVQVSLRYRLRGFDRTDVARTQYLTFARRSGAGLVITGDGTAQGLRDDTEIWDGGPLSVIRGRRSLVIGSDAPLKSLREIAGRLDQAVPTVTGVVGPGWSRRVVALLPATEEQTVALAGGGRSLREIAALATLTQSPDGTPGNDRIVVSPAAFPRLNEIGQRVVLTHELTHVATHGAADTRTPTWLIEGFADYVGYKGLRVPVRSAARELRREVAGGRLPRALPGRAEFDDATGRLSQAYEEAWLACKMVAERYGEDRLIRLYTAAGTHKDALEEILGIDMADFAAMWRRYLRAELS